MLLEEGEEIIAEGVGFVKEWLKKPGAGNDKIAAEVGATRVQVALSWTLRQDGLIAIPKASSVAHVRENRAAADIVLSDAQFATLDAAFPRPRDRRPLEML